MGFFVLASKLLLIMSLVGILILVYYHSFASFFSFALGRVRFGYYSLISSSSQLLDH